MSFSISLWKPKDNNHKKKMSLSENLSINIGNLEIKKIVNFCLSYKNPTGDY